MDLCPVKYMRVYLVPLDVLDLNSRGMRRLCDGSLGYKCSTRKRLCDPSNVAGRESSGRHTWSSWEDSGWSQPKSRYDLKPGVHALAEANVSPFRTLVTEKGIQRLKIGLSIDWSLINYQSKPKTLVTFVTCVSLQRPVGHFSPIVDLSEEGPPNCQPTGKKG
jgi:hypothetical protein